MSSTGLSVSSRDPLEICKQLVDMAIDAGAEQAEAIVESGRGVETNIESGEVHTVQSREETVFGLRVIRQGSKAFVTANDVSERRLADSVKEVLEQTSVIPADEANAFAPPGDSTTVDGLYDPAIEEMTVGDSSRLAAALAEAVKSRDPRVTIDSGSVNFSIERSALVNSLGIEKEKSATMAGGSLFGMAVDGEDIASFDYDSESSCKLDGFEAALLKTADRFTDKCVAGLGAGEGLSYRGPVVLSPEAVAEFLLSNLMGALCADTVRKGRSPLADKLGQLVACQAFSLVDDATVDSMVTSRPFDREGVATAKTAIIEGGRLRTFLFNQHEATLAGGNARSTGHAAGSASSPPGIGPSYIELAAGEESDLLASDGGPVVLVNRFSGSTNAVTGDFSGVVKNGFLVENGQRRPIRETMIAGNLFEALRDISALSSERRLISSSALVPSARIENVSVTAG